MIDDYAKTMVLLRKLEAQQPIPVRATPALIGALKAQGVTIAPDQELSTRRVFYMGDEGGIMCDVTPPHLGARPVICSVTHIEIDPEHPLAAEVRAYQAERVRRLARSGNLGKPASSTIRPRARRRR